MVKLSVMPEIENVMQNPSSELGSKFLGFWFLIFRFLGFIMFKVSNWLKRPDYFGLIRPTPPLMKNVEYVNIVD